VGAARDGSIVSGFTQEGGFGDFRRGHAGWRLYASAATVRRCRWAATSARDASRRMPIASCAWPGLARREPDLTLAEICAVWSAPAAKGFRRRCFGDFSIATTSPSKKVDARERAGSPGRLAAAAGMVRRPTDLDLLKLVFIDETAAATNMARRYGRRRRGQRLRCGVPHRHYKLSPSSAPCVCAVSSRPKPTIAP